MKKPHAQWLTLHKADLDRNTSIEIIWQTVPNTLNLLLFRIKHNGTKPRLVTEEIGPYRSLVELRHQLCILFGELSAQRVCHPCPWLPPGIPVAHAVTFGATHDDRCAESPPMVHAKTGTSATALGRRSSSSRRKRRI